MHWIKHTGGESQSNVIMWLGIVIGVLIIVLFAARSMSPRHLELEIVLNDLEKLVGHVNNACNSEYYYAKFNPHSRSGNLIFNSSGVCIESSFQRCRMTVCDHELDENISFLGVEFISIEKEGDFSITAED